MIARSSVTGTARHVDSPRKLRRPWSYRGLVGGVLYIEGLVTLAIGLVFLFYGWPPIAVGHVHSNPISHVGMVICLVAVAYMVIVGGIFFIYNQMHPARKEEESSLVERSRKYATRGRGDGYLFDETVCCEADAEEAFLARQLY